MNLKKRIIGVVACVAALILGGCGRETSDQVIIYSSAEDYRNEYFLKRLDEEFPQYDVVIEYLSTGNNAAKLKAEGKETDCDIVLGLEYAYLDMLRDNFSDLSNYDTSIFTEDVIETPIKYLPELRNSACIIINTEILNEKNLQEPKSYEDLLKPEYKGLITMPNPKTSGTGYMFLKSLVNSWGEERAFDYFDQLTPNVLQYTSSGSGPVSSLLQGESLIGLGMTAQAVTELNKGAPFKILYFDNMAPYSVYGNAIIEGKESKKAVKDVFDYFYTTLIRENNEKYFPEAIYMDGPKEIKNYPTNFKYADMSNNSFSERERLLQKWNH